MIHTSKRYFSFLILLVFTGFSFAMQAQQLVGHATHFEKLGTPFGGCGVPTEFVDSDAFVALNVFKGPNVGPNDFDRPIAAGNEEIKGEFNNGLNCGRWVKVTILEDCVGGPNSGKLGEGFCNEPGSSYQDSEFTGAVQYMVVTDACGDNNGWCRDDPFHLDLHTSAVNQFKKDGELTTNMLETSFNNPKIEWEYVKAPDYSGDIKIHFMEDSFKWWASVFFTNLENGIHGVQQKINGEWVNLSMNSDLGQAYLLQNTDVGSFTVRIIDVDDQLINGEREYSFDFPASCGERCSNPGTPVTYTINDPVLHTASHKQLESISVFPNPVTDEFNINNLGDNSWHLYDSMGRLKERGESTVVNASNLESGIYYLEIKGVRFKVVKSN